MEAPPPYSGRDLVSVQQGRRRPVFLQGVDKFLSVLLQIKIPEENGPVSFLTPSFHSPHFSPVEDSDGGAEGKPCRSTLALHAVLLGDTTSVAGASLRAFPPERPAVSGKWEPVLSVPGRAAVNGLAPEMVGAASVWPH